METIAWSEVSYARAPLPKLAQEMNRRDSLSSSRTGDSGYNSDPDVSLSPLEYVSNDQVPYTSATFTFDSSALFDVKEAVSSTSKRVTTKPCNLILFKKSQDCHRDPAPQHIDVTSAPAISNDRSNSSTPRETTFRKHVLGANATAEVEHWISNNLQPQQPKQRNSSIVSLSSTESCDMYSNADDNSEYEEVVGGTVGNLSKATLKTIELIMRKIELNLNHAAFRQCASNHSSRAQGGSASRSSRGSSNAKRAGGKRESLPPDDPDDDDANKRRRISITTTEDSESGPRFACPFYKHDPTRYRNRRTCPGPGWPTVHRMKEHLYRAHAQPIFCNRCYLMFDSDNELSSHQRADPCPVSAPQPIDGIGRETLKNLRKRSPANRLEEDKWRDTYQWLFPDVSPDDIPSPYYDSASPTEGSRRFRRELLERVRQELFATAEREPGPVEQRLLRQVAGIIQRCENELLATSNPPHLSAAPGLLHPAMPPNRRASAPSILPQEPQPPLSIAPPVVPNICYYAPDTQVPLGDSENRPQSPPHPQVNGGIISSTGPFVDPDPLTFIPNEWIDWISLFPPGPDGQDASLDFGAPSQQSSSRGVPERVISY